MTNFLLNKLRRVRKEDQYRETSTRWPITILEPNSVASETYRTLRTNLLSFSLDNPSKAIVLTSPGLGEGKSTTCANLGVVMAQADKSTLIMDCDFRRPFLHKIFEMRNLHGITDVLTTRRRLQEVWGEPMEGLKVLPTGSIPPNPHEILGSQRFSAFLDGVREEFDYVLVDCPPIGVVADAAILATYGAGFLLILDALNTRKFAVRQAMRSLNAVGANVLGTVMNNVKVSKGDPYYSYGHTHDVLPEN